MEIKKLIVEKIDTKKFNEVTKEVPVTVNVNLYEEEVIVGKDMVINHTYTDQGQQMMILDIGAPVSIAGISWMTQYLEEFDLSIEEMKSVKCQQPFRFGPCKRYVSEILIKLPDLFRLT